MHEITATPPPRGRVPGGPAGLIPACAAAAAALLATVIARGALDGRVLLPGCGFRWLTGHPCPGCGGTHSLAALGKLQLAEAFAFNPAVAAVAVIAVLVLPLAWMDERFNRGRLQAVLTRVWRTQPGLKPGLVGVVLLNWIYLLFARG